MLLASLLALVTPARAASARAEAERMPDATRDELVRSVAVESARLLQRSAQVWSMTQSCSSCHHQMLGTVAVLLLEERKLSTDRAMVEVQLGALRRRLEAKRQPHYFGLSSANPAISESYALWALAAAGHPAGPDTDAAVHALALRQGGDGRWPSLAHQPPLEDSAVTATALTLRALVTYAPPGRRDELTRRVARARDWLRALEPADAEESALQLLGLHWAGMTTTELAPRLDALRSKQNPDGGWSQLPTRPSDAYATGQALVALHAVGAEAVAGETYRRGVDFLLSTVDRASWHVRSRAEPRFTQLPETGYPHGVDQFSSYAGSSWAAMALALAVSPGRSEVLAASAAERSTAVATELPRIVSAALFSTPDDLRSLLSELSDAAVAQARGPLGLTPLLAAAPDPVKTAMLLDRGAAAGEASEIGLRPLHVAAWSEGAAESVRLLLAHGAAPEVATPLGLSAGYLAAISGRVESLELLTAASGRALRWPAKDAPHPLLVAVERADASMVEALLRSGTDADAPRNAEGLTALQLAVRNRTQPVARVLLEHGADPRLADTEGRTALHWAATSDAGHAGIVEMLLLAGADATVKSRRGRSPLDAARESGNVQIATLLASLEP